MDYFYQPSTGAFFHASVHSEIPEDTVGVPDELYKALQNRSLAQEIVAGDGGMPMLVTSTDSPVRRWKLAKSSALDALIITDKVAFRCFKAGVTFPADWQDYVAILRAIIRSDEVGEPPETPSQPAYPIGT